MTAIEAAPKLAIQSNTSDELVVNPSDITFHDLNRDTVLVQVKIRNESEHRSKPTLVTLESAAFGAFVPWRPLAKLPVPAIEPGESHVVSVQAVRPHPKPLGDFDRVPPSTVLTAVSSAPDEPAQERRNNFAAIVAQIMNRKETARSPGKNVVIQTVIQGPSLPADLWELFGREQTHWAGNINVFMGKREVERHFAKSLRIYAGRTNMAIFDVGGHGKPDAYAFEIAGLGPDWKAALHNRMSRESFMVGASDEPIQEKRWVETQGFMMMILAIQPPIVCENGNLQVHVTRRSSGKTATVEFELDPTAKGPGCYIAE